ncbi:8311_t:CDS:10 [Diversispora eburnea]|uniref:8311_t:CDS:1 n=1 Tax=Diversispora eburnea TaxID=1213867 RepID=A0A9N8YP77_9GLOM|nr:8311_t:CDS:10 [Diversispora eburnea]
MKVFKTPTRTAVTEWIERMTSSSYQGEEEDLADVYQLCEVVNLQSSGPKEATKALKHIFKYGNTHSHLRGLTALVENCGEKFQSQISSPKFIERLKILASSPNTDPKVYKRLMILFSQWSDDFKSQPSMNSIAHLHENLSHRSGSVRRGSASSKPVSPPSSSSSTIPKEKRKVTKPIKSNNKPKVEREIQTYSSEKVNEEIGLATQNAANLINVLTLLGSNADKDDPELQTYVRKCKSSSEQLIKIIATVTEGTMLGPLLQSNDQLQGALAIYSDFASGVSKDKENNESTEISKRTQAAKIHKDFEDLIDFDSFSTAKTFLFKWSFCL